MAKNKVSEIYFVAKLYLHLNKYSNNNAARALIHLTNWYLYKRQGENVICQSLNLFVVFQYVQMDWLDWPIMPWSIDLFVN